MLINNFIKKEGRALPVFILLDVSGSMQGEKIETVRWHKIVESKLLRSKQWMLKVEKEQGKNPCSFVFLWCVQDKEKTQPNHSFVTK